MVNFEGIPDMLKQVIPGMNQERDEDREHRERRYNKRHDEDEDRERCYSKHDDEDEDREHQPIGVPPTSPKTKPIIRLLNKSFLLILFSWRSGATGVSRIWYLRVSDTSLSKPKKHRLYLCLFTEAQKATQKLTDRATTEELA